MRALDEIVDDILEDIRDVATGRLNRADVVRAVNEAKDLAVTLLLESGENVMAFLSAAGAAPFLNVVAGEPKIALPQNFARIIRVEAKVGTGYIPITENRTGEGFGFDTESSEGLSEDTEYQILWPYLVLRPPPAQSVANGLRLYNEQSVPDLLMGKVVASADTTHVQLAGVVNRTLGQYPASMTDDIYNELSLVLVNASGATRTVVRITDYVGSTRIATYTPAVAIDNTWSYAMLTPFLHTFEMCDKYLLARAPIVLATTKRPFDVSGYSARANELEEAIEKRASPLTGSSRGMMPFDMANG